MGVAEDGSEWDRVGPEVVRLPVDPLRFDHRVRAGADAAHVRALADAATPWPPIVVHRATMSVVDGVHRVRAARLRGDREIDARFHEGSSRDAFVLAVRSNTESGLPLTAADREAAATRIIDLHPEWSDRAIAAAAGLAAKTVAAIRSRSRVGARGGTRVGRDGRVRPLDPIAGRRRAYELVKATPGMSVRRLAREAGVSVGTASDVRARAARGDDPVPPGLRARRAREVEPAPDHLALLRSLTRDPSLRFRAEGRLLLRWLGMRTVLAEDRAAVVAAVPPHCAPVVADLARACGDAWRELAEEVERRGRSAGVRRAR
ncbi:ParB/RepB/Spo0J family partition protein [Actinosynnema sp. NPDC020468]|uniref:ParB/RepB/Spo0J family partition protein n=1 Tax=Actinosynnema sp. NPDC020468 TaxID=3154488 RepID=UPI00340324CC